jgi:hypothetical protein
MCNGAASLALVRPSRERPSAPGLYGKAVRQAIAKTLHGCTKTQINMFASVLSRCSLHEGK